MAASFSSQNRTLISSATLSRRKGRIVYWTVLSVVLVVFTLIFVGPLYWMVTGGFKSAQEVVANPPTLFPKHPQASNYHTAWTQLKIARLLFNTLYYAFGALAFQLVFDVAAAYAISKLRPVLGKLILGGMLATLMIPAAVLIVPQYMTVLNLPVLHFNLIGTPWAIWLPTVANGFNIFLLKRYFDSIPRELIEAAQIDGSGPFRTLWSVVLPISRPILGVTSIFTIVTSFKDFIWPLLVMSDSENMTLSVGLAQTAGAVSQDQVMGGLVIASIPTIIVFFIFQRHIMAGLTVGSLKG
jgi:multiple sugar transport system permease protein